MIQKMLFTVQKQSHVMNTLGNDCEKNSKRKYAAVVMTVKNIAQGKARRRNRTIPPWAFGCRTQHAIHRPVQTEANRSSANSPVSPKKSIFVMGTAFVSALRWASSRPKRNIKVAVSKM